MTVTKFNRYIFDRAQLETLTLESPVPPEIDPTAFPEAGTLKTIYVPNGSLKAYRKAYRKENYNIVEMQ